MTQFESRNITMMMDLYEMTMAYGYFKENDTEKKVAFDVFYRRNPDGGGFSIFAGLEQVIEYLENMHFEDEDVEYFRSLNLFDEDFLTYLKNFRFNGDVYAFEEGTIMYPNEPVVTVVAPLIEAQLVETAILAQINHQSLIATKARRIVKAAAGRGVSDFGARRAHNMDAAIYGARASYIGGVNGTATVSAGQMFGIPVGGTHAHSWVMEHSDELTAFRSYAKVFPNNCTLLVDTYDVLKSGVPNAIKVFQEMKDAGIPLTRYGIRLDSGDLAYLSRKARKMLDKAGFTDAKIVVSNSLDEYTITSILSQGGCIDSFGVGERMITAKTDPVFGAVYKICAVEENGKFAPRIKVSETVEKITNPGFKHVFRLYDKKTGKARGDVITVADETVPELAEYEIFDPNAVWKRTKIRDYYVRNLRVQIFDKGRCIYESPGVDEIRDYCKAQMETMWDETLRFENPQTYYVDLSQKLWDVKNSLLSEFAAK